MLLFIGSEILSVESYVAAGGTLMNVANLRRGRYGTTPADHASGARGWLIYRADLVALTHVAFTTGQTTVRTGGIHALTETTPDWIALRCASNAMWEGRLVATRWLIDFIGIKADKATGVALRNRKIGQHDWDIENLRPGSYFNPSGPGSQTLADIWLGCTRASSHPTWKSGHPSVKPDRLNAALEIVMNHLQRELYGPFGHDLEALAMAAPPPGNY